MRSVNIVHIIMKKKNIVAYNFILNIQDYIFFIVRITI